MTHILDQSYLYQEQSTDKGITILRPKDGSEFLILDVVAESGNGCMLKLDFDDAKKLAVRIYATIKQARGELPERDLKNAN